MTRTMPLRQCLAIVAGVSAVASLTQRSNELPPQNNTQLVFDHVAAAINQTFRPPAGVLRFPYLVPAGPYQTAWDWDSLFLGIAGLPFGSLPYMRGTFMNYLAATNLTTGELPGGLTPSGPTGVLYHAKPVIIQGAWLAAQADGSYADFQAFQPAMQALLAYWQRAPRVDATTGLPLWHDQLETGADNLVYSECPSAYSPECWVEAADAYTLSSPDLLVFLAREELAYANFCEAWAGVRSLDEPLAAASLRSTATQHRERASALRDLLNTYLWHWDDAQHIRGWYCAYNVSSRQQIRNRTYQMAWPLWANMTASSAQVAASVAAVLSADMLTPYGVRSTSAADPRYSNANIIDPYSNWRGPIWINANAVLAYSLRSQGYEQEAAQLADAVVALLASDLVVNDGQWHECYDSDNGTALAAPGFLSWNTLGATLQANVAAGVDPFSLNS